jgi:hypothetical protein
MKMMANIFSWSDNSYWVLQTVSLVLVGLTVVVGGLAIMVGKASNQRQAGKILDLQKSVSDAEKDLAVAKTKQAEAERTLLEIQERFVPRTLEGKTRETFLAALKDAAPGKVVVRTLGNDPEAAAFALQIRDALISAGYQVGPLQGIMHMTTPGHAGIVIGVRNEEAASQPPFAGALQRAFESIGMEAKGAFGDIVPALDNDTVVIDVGIKPNKPQTQ